MNQNVSKGTTLDFETATVKDFEDIPELDMYQRAAILYDFMRYSEEKGWMKYRKMNRSGCGPEIGVDTPEYNGKYVNLVSNDYLGFTQHPRVIEAAIEGIKKYGTGAGASPMIGGFFEYHQEVEEKMAHFFHRPSGYALTYTTGYTANSATLQCLLQKEDIAITDMAVHASVYEGLTNTNKKRFIHNNLNYLEMILKDAQQKYRTKLVIIDGVYSQDGDLSHLKDILFLTHKYGGYLLVDDAHGIGIIGETGRGVGEKDGVLDQIDIITGTFSKTFGSVGGYVIASPELLMLLKVHSRQYVFSASAPPTVLGISKAIDLIDEEPVWMKNLWKNIEYFKTGLLNLGLDIGNTRSAIIPVKIKDAHLTGEIAQQLLSYGVYANPIVYPGVSKKDSRIRMALMATHTQKNLDKVIGAFKKVSEPLIKK